jgi:hypothetical protein
MIFADSDIFVIDLRYRRDVRYGNNRLFLDSVIEEGILTTSIFNILEVCGILSFNLNRQQLYELYFYFPQKYNLQGVAPLKTAAIAMLPSFKLSSIIDTISSKASFGDSLVICAVNEKKAPIDYFVSWNAGHFKGKLAVPVVTPAEYLDLVKPSY